MHEKQKNEREIAEEECKNRDEIEKLKREKEITVLKNIKSLEEEFQIMKDKIMNHYKKNFEFPKDQQQVGDEGNSSSYPSSISEYEV